MTVRVDHLSVIPGLVLGALGGALGGALILLGNRLLGGVDLADFGGDE